MRIDIRLHGVLSHGEKCNADLSIYVSDFQDIDRAAIEAQHTAPWLIVASGWPDVPVGEKVQLERVERLDESFQQQQELPSRKMLGSLFDGILPWNDPV